MISYFPYSPSAGKIPEEHFMAFVTSETPMSHTLLCASGMFPSQIWFLGGGREASFVECPLCEKDTK